MTQDGYIDDMVGEEQELEFGVWNELGPDYFLLPLEGDGELIIIIDDPLEIRYEFPYSEAEDEYPEYYTEKIKVKGKEIHMRIDATVYNMVPEEDIDLDAAASRAIKPTQIQKHKDKFLDAEGLVPGVRKLCMTIIHELERGNYSSKIYEENIEKELE